MRRGITRLLTAALAGALVLGPSAAHAGSVTTITVAPATVSVGETARVTATGLDGRESVEFALEPTGAASFTGAGAQATAIDATVTGGTAQVEVSATSAGEVAVTVGDGTSILAETEIVVASSSAEPSSSASSPSDAASTAAGDDSAQAEPDPEAEGGRLAFVLIPVLAAAVVVVGGILVIARGRRGRRGD